MAKRPQVLNPDVVENIVSRLLPNVKIWLEEQGEVISDKDERDVFDIITELLHQQKGQWDGYELARAFETNQDWQPNALLVEILDDAKRISVHCLREAVIRWAGDEGKTLSYKIGEVIKFKFSSNEPAMEGQIISLHPETLEYSVLVNEDLSLLISEEISVLADD